MDSAKQKALTIYQKHLGTLLVVTPAVGFGLMPIFAKFTYEAGVNVITSF